MQAVLDGGELSAPGEGCAVGTREALARQARASEAAALQQALACLDEPLAQ